MLHRNCLKFQLTDGRDASRLHLAQLGNRILAEEIQCLQSRINTTRCPLGKPGCVIGMGMGEQNRRRRDASELSKPVCPAIDHDPCIAMLDEERAMISMSRGAKLDASSGSEKGQLHMCLAYLVCDANAQSRRNRQCNSSIWPFTEAPKTKDASGITMKDWNIVITVNDSESFGRPARNSNASATASRRTIGTSRFSLCPMSRSSEVDFDQALQSIHRLACSIHKLLESARCHRPLALDSQLSGML